MPQKDDDRAMTTMNSRGQIPAWQRGKFKRQDKGQSQEASDVGKEDSDNS
jgi:hypothetical protein